MEIFDPEDFILSPVTEILIRSNCWGCKHNVLWKESSKNIQTVKEKEIWAKTMLLYVIWTWFFCLLVWGEEKPFQADLSNKEASLHFLRYLGLHESLALRVSPHKLVSFPQLQHRFSSPQYTVAWRGEPARSFPARRRLFMGHQGVGKLGNLWISGLGTNYAGIQ